MDTSLSEVHMKLGLWENTQHKHTMIQPPTHHTTTGQPLSGQQPVRFDSSDFCEVRGHLYRPGHRSLACVCVEFWWFPGASQHRKGPISPWGDSTHLQTKLPTVLHQNWLTCDSKMEERGMWNFRHALLTHGFLCAHNEQP